MTIRQQRVFLSLNIEKCLCYPKQYQYIRSILNHVWIAYVDVLFEGYVKRG